jgi:hypothetical protein
MCEREIDTVKNGLDAPNQSTLDMWHVREKIILSDPDRIRASNETETGARIIPAKEEKPKPNICSNTIL